MILGADQKKQRLWERERELVSDHNLFTLTSNYITFVYLELLLMQEAVYGVKLKYKGNIGRVVLLYFS